MLVPPVMYDIIDTDYLSYTCAYSCMGLFGLKFELMWIMTREPTFSERIKDLCFNAFHKLGINVNTLKIVNQDEEICGKMIAKSATDIALLSEVDSDHEKRENVADNSESLEESEPLYKHEDDLGTDKYIVVDAIHQEVEHHEDEFNEDLHTSLRNLQIPIKYHEDSLDDLEINEDKLQNEEHTNDEPYFFEGSYSKVK